MIVSFYSPPGALNPLSAAAAAAAAAGRVALAGQTGANGVLLVSNLNDEVSNTTPRAGAWQRAAHTQSDGPSEALAHLSCSPPSTCGSLLIIVSVFDAAPARERPKISMERFYLFVCFFDRLNQLILII